MSYEEMSYGDNKSIPITYSHSSPPMFNVPDKIVTKCAFMYQITCGIVTSFRSIEDN